MTYDPNDPRRPVVRELDGISAGAMAGIAFALLLFLGVMFWAFTSDRQTASTGTPPATTGQRAPAPAPARAGSRTCTGAGACAEGAVVPSRSYVEIEGPSRMRVREGPFDCSGRLGTSAYSGPALFLRLRLGLLAGRHECLALMRLRDFGQHQRGLLLH